MAVSGGAYVAIIIISVILFVIKVVVCYYKCAILPNQTVKPHRIGVIGLGHRPLPPGRGLSRLPSTGPKLGTVASQAFQLHEGGAYTWTANRNDPSPHSRLERDPIPLPHIRNFEGNEEHSSPISPPPYTE